MKKVRAKFVKTNYVALTFKDVQQHSDFLQWMLENGVGPNVRGGMSAPVYESGFYSDEQVERIKQYIN
jgi:hypothetical protein